MGGAGRIRLAVQAVYASHDDDPYALQRDAQVRGALAEHGIALHTSKDHVVFERDEVLSAARTPYSVFTPYKASWLRQLNDAALTELAENGCDLPLPEGVIKGVVDRLGRNAETSDGVAVDLQSQARGRRLQVTRHILQLRKGGELRQHDRRPLEQLGHVGVL